MPPIQALHLIRRATLALEFPSSSARAGSLDCVIRFYRLYLQIRPARPPENVCMQRDRASRWLL